jgi:hypothetical protein
MNSVRSVPVTAAAFAALTVFLSGCIAYDAAGMVMDAGTSAVSATGDIVMSPFGGSDRSDKKKSQ